MRFSELLARARRGDDAARAALVERFYADVQAAVHRNLELDLRRGRSWMAALFSTGDVVHEVFLRVLADLDAFEGDDERTFASFLTSAITHRLLDTIRFHEAARRDGRRTAPDNVTDLELVEDSTSPTAAAARDEEARAVEEAMGALVDRDRDLLELRFKRGASYPQIAAELGIGSADAARKALCAAQTRLLLALRARGIR